MTPRQAPQCPRAAPGQQRAPAPRPAAALPAPLGPLEYWCEHTKPRTRTRGLYAGTYLHAHVHPHPGLPFRPAQDGALGPTRPRPHCLAAPGQRSCGSGARQRSSSTRCESQVQQGGRYQHDHQHGQCQYPSDLDSIQVATPAELRPLFTCCVHKHCFNYSLEGCRSLVCPSRTSLFASKLCLSCLSAYCTMWT